MTVRPELVEGLTTNVEHTQKNSVGTKTVPTLRTIDLLQGGAIKKAIRPSLHNNED